MYAIIAAILGPLLTWILFTHFYPEYKKWQEKKLGKVRLLKIIKNQAEHLQKYFEEIIDDLNKNEKISDPFYDFPFDLSDNIINLITQYGFEDDEIKKFIDHYIILLSCRNKKIAQKNELNIFLESKQKNNIIIEECNKLIDKNNKISLKQFLEKCYPTIGLVYSFFYDDIDLIKSGIFNIVKIIFNCNNSKNKNKNENSK
ncbi:hypothetical protein AMJ80_01060 [bacterium SM23_31]|nr:MAG: hypothetical protein AMJ80_01060 [bacterium SM23_31]